MSEDDEIRELIEHTKLRELAQKIASSPDRKGEILIDWYLKLGCVGPNVAEFGFLLYSIAQARGELANPIQVNISGGNVANLNLGEQIGTINATVQSLSKSDESHRELAEALKQLTEAVLNDESLSDGQKKEATQVIAEVAQQAKAEPEKRSGGTIKALIAGFPAVISAATEVTKLWAQWGPVISKFFGF